MPRRRLRSSDDEYRPESRRRRRNSRSVTNSSLTATNSERNSTVNNDQRESSEEDEDLNSDIDYQPDRTVLHRVRQRLYRRNHPARRITELRSARRNDQDSMIRRHDDSDPEEIPETGIASEPHYLGERNNICLFCDAVHFPGSHVCCSKGQIFIPPYEKQPEPLFSLLFDINHQKRNQFFNHILTYNTLFSFASTQYDHHPLPRALGGARMLKANGAIRHFASAALPKTMKPQYMRFANFYVYEGNESLELRKQSMLASKLDEHVLELIQETMDNHPFARMYKRLGELIREEEQDGYDPNMMRMKIVNPYEVDVTCLNQHPGTYQWERHGKFISLFYSATVDQSILPRGLTIYPKLRGSKPRPIYDYMPQVNSLCYPIIFPRGEPGFTSKTFPRVVPKPYRVRLADFLQAQGPDANFETDLDEGSDSTNVELDDRISNNSERMPPRRQTHQFRADLNLEESEDETDNDFENSILNTDNSQRLSGSEDEDDYNNELDRMMVEDRAASPTERLRFIHRGGEYYPQRVENSTTENQLEELQSEIDSGDDLNFNDDEEQDDIVVGQRDSLESGEAREDVDQEHDYNVSDNESEMDSDDLNTDRDVRPQPTDRKRKFCSAREHALYILQDRKRFRNRITATRKLGQQFIMDIALRIKRAQFDFIRKHRTEYVTSTKKKVLNAFQRLANRRNLRIGAVTTIPVTVPGSPRYLKRRFEDAVAMANHLGKPDLFITFTCNTGWKEIKDHLNPGEIWADRPQLVCEVFEKKKEQFLDCVVGKPKSKRCRRGSRHAGIFGAVAWYTYSIEFQRTGKPHMHLIAGLRNHIRTTLQVDMVSQAVLPPLTASSTPEEKKLRLLIETFMIHNPCEKNRIHFDEGAYCNEGRKHYWKTCRKRFPKPFSDVTELGDKNYPDLKRPDDGEHCFKKDSEGNLVKATNAHVVPYNRFLLSKFEAHINVEVISSVKFCKYIYKYIFKGFDRVLVECLTDIDLTGKTNSGNMTMQGHILYPRGLKIPPGALEKRNTEARELLAKQRIPRRENGNEVLVYDECNMVEDMGVMTASEAMHLLSGYPRAAASHHVLTGFVHGEDDEPVVVEFGKEADALARAQANQINSMMKAWFELNSDESPFKDKARSMTLRDVLLHFSYNKKTGEFKPVKNRRDHYTISKIKSVHPRYLELFALRLLVIHQKGPKSYEDLRTVNGHQYQTYAEAAKALRLMNDEQEWHRAMQEAAEIESPSALRRMFVSILLHCAPKDPLSLWEVHKESMYQNNNWSAATKEAHALHHIQTGLQAHGMSLSDFQGFPAVDRDELPSQQFLEDDSRGPMISNENCSSRGREMYQKLNEGQKTAVDTIITSIDNGETTPFFIDGPGGCGKTFVYDVLYHLLTGKGYEVMSVAHTGIAAALLPYGTTVHRAFRLPVGSSDAMHSQIELDSDTAEQIRKCRVVLWDEAVMSEKRIYDAVMELFFALHIDRNTSEDWGDVTFVFGGDWRQTLPIVDGIEGESVISHTLKATELWKSTRVLKLTENLRAQQDREYAKWVEEIGNGVHFENGTSDIKVTSDMLVKDETTLIAQLYGNGKVEDPKYLQDTCILTVDNETSLVINDRVLKMKKGEQKEYLSVDNYDEERGFMDMDPEIYNQHTPSGLPPHALKLKVGSPVILLRNINVHRGLCNGLRMKITKLGEDMSEVERRCKKRKLEALSEVSGSILLDSHTNNVIDMDPLEEYQHEETMIESENTSVVADLSIFASLEENDWSNDGKFVIVAKIFLPEGTFEKLNCDLLKILLRDVEANVSEFSSFGDKALELNTYNIGDVINVSNFNWMKKSSQYSFDFATIHGILMEYVGKFNDKTTVTKDLDMSAKIGEAFKLPSADHLFTINEIKKSTYRFVARFEKAYEKKVFGSNKSLRSLMFRSLDSNKNRIQITYFNELAEQEFDLTKNKIYCIEGAIPKEKTSDYFEVAFHGSTYTMISEVQTAQLSSPLTNYNYADKDYRAVSISDIMDPQKEIALCEIVLLVRQISQKEKGLEIVAVDSAKQNGRALAIIIISCECDITVKVGDLIELKGALDKEAFLVKIIAHNLEVKDRETFKNDYEDEAKGILENEKIPFAKAMWPKSKAK